VQANTRVLAGVKLSIQPGVEVVFSDNTALTVLGELEAVGSQAQPIHFSGETQTPGDRHAEQCALRVRREELLDLRRRLR
jgi:hypothetical protein